MEERAQWQGKWGGGLPGSGLSGGGGAIWLDDGLDLRAGDIDSIGGKSGWWTR